MMREAEASDLTVHYEVHSHLDSRVSPQVAVVGARVLGSQVTGGRLSATDIIQFINVMKH